MRADNSNFSTACIAAEQSVANLDNVIQVLRWRPDLVQLTRVVKWSEGQDASLALGILLSASDAPTITEYGFDESLTNFEGLGPKLLPLTMRPDGKLFDAVSKNKNLPDLAVRHGKWKLLCDYDGGRAKLYSVITDPGESKNVAGAQPAVTKDLSRQLIDWYQSMPSKEPNIAVQAPPK